MATNAVLQCDGCGQQDDHPKHHYGAETYHHDCTPYRVIEDMTHVTTYDRDDANQLAVVDRVELAPEDYPEGVKQFFELRKLAEGGTRGDKLRAKALKLPTPATQKES